MKKVIIGADHRGFILKEKVKIEFSKQYDFFDVGSFSEEPCDYPDIAEALAKAIQQQVAERGILICGSGVGASVAVNKFKSIRAAVCHDTFSAHQGVEDDDMNVLCLGGGIVGPSLAMEIISNFLNASFKHEERFIRRLEKVKKFEEGNNLI